VFFRSRPSRWPAATLADRVPPARRTDLIAKVPPVTALFWIIKVLTTGMGETASDFLARTVDPPIAVGAAAAVPAI
jgi:uncharacterized membrane-anchored protein